MSVVGVDPRPNHTLHPLTLQRSEEVRKGPKILHRSNRVELIGNRPNTPLLDSLLIHERGKQITQLLLDRTDGRPTRRDDLGGITEDRGGLPLDPQREIHVDADRRKVCRDLRHGQPTAVNVPEQIVLRTHRLIPAVPQHTQADSCALVISPAFSSDSSLSNGGAKRTRPLEALLPCMAAVPPTTKLRYTADLPAGFAFPAGDWDRWPWPWPGPRPIDHPCG